MKNTQKPENGSLVTVKDVPSRNTFYRKIYTYPVSQTEHHEPITVFQQQHNLGGWGEGWQSQIAILPFRKEVSPTPPLGKILLYHNQTKVKMLPVLFCCLFKGGGVLGVKGDGELVEEERAEVNLKFSSSAISFITRIFSKFGAASTYISLEVSDFPYNMRSQRGNIILDRSKKKWFLKSANFYSFFVQNTDKYMIRKQIYSVSVVLTFYRQWTATPGKIS